jgi:hypothetical protein
MRPLKPLSVLIIKNNSTIPVAKLRLRPKSIGFMLSFVISNNKWHATPEIPVSNRGTRKKAVTLERNVPAKIKNK